MNSLTKLIDNNRAWAKRTVEADPDFFNARFKQQNPDYLWIGCADSRVPATQITGLMPGEMFVHRNIANLVIHTDLSLLSVLQYAVEVLQVEHIIVCGHYNCGGVRAAMEPHSHGLIDHWLRHIQDVESRHSEELQALPAEARLDRLCELNVLSQRENLCRTTIIQDAWARGQKIEVHGWIYSLKQGHLQPLTDSICKP